MMGFTIGVIGIVIWAAGVLLLSKKPERRQTAKEALQGCGKFGLMVVAAWVIERALGWI